MVALVCVAAVLGAAMPAAMAAAGTPELLWHVETLDGVVVETHEADRPINPASVVKLATTLEALDRLGPDHRFATVFSVAGAADADGAVASLAVRGGGDPDFHVENAFLVARELNANGVRALRGALSVDESFWIGWATKRSGRRVIACRISLS